MYLRCYNISLGDSIYYRSLEFLHTASLRNAAPRSPNHRKSLRLCIHLHALGVGSRLSVIYAETGIYTVTTVAMHREDRIYWGERFS